MASCTMMRMLFGVWLRTRLTARLASAVTRVTPMPMTSALSMRVVTASAEQMPSTCTAIGLTLITGLNSAVLSFLPNSAAVALMWGLRCEGFSGRGRSRRRPASSARRG